MPMRPVSHIKQPGLQEGHAMTAGAYHDDDISLDAENEDPMVVANALEDKLLLPNSDANE